jgi:hypothetical protein
MKKLWNIEKKTKNILWKIENILKEVMFIHKKI